MAGYHIETTDGQLGFLTDFVIDDKSWHMEYLIIEMHSLVKGKKALISCKHVKSIRWDTLRVLMDVTSSMLQDNIAIDEPEFLMA